MRGRSLLFGGALILMLIGATTASWSTPNWQRIGPLLVTKVYCFAATQAGDTFFVGTSHGIYRHPDPDGPDYMAEINNGLPELPLFPGGHCHPCVTALAIDPNGKVYAGAGINNDGVYRSEDGGLNWTKLEQSSGYVVTSMVIDREGRIYVGTASDGVLFSTDEGNSWVLLNDGLVTGYDLTVNDLAIQDNDDVIAMLWAPLSCPVFHLTHGSQSWQPRSIDNASGQGGSLEIDAVGAIYVRDYSGCLYRSGDDGMNWTKLNLPDNTPVRAMTTCKGGHLFAGHTDSDVNDCKFFVTLNNGGSWETHDGIGQLNALYHSPEGTLFAGTDSGVYSTGTIHSNCCMKPGDVNNDNKCTVGDAVSLIGYIFRDGQVPCCQGFADVNGDGKVNSGDAVYIISYIFRGGPEPVQ